jgi:hypothetical protein
MKSARLVLALSTLALLAPLAADPTSKASSVEGREAPLLKLNEHLVEGWHADADGLDLTEPADVFFYVFDRLPDEVMVYPGENYYYWQLVVRGREIWGNIRLPAGRRDRGVVSFGYAQFNPYPSRGGDRKLSRAKYFTVADGVVVDKKDDFTYKVTAGKKSVVFHLNRIDQSPPTTFEIRENERFIQRTFDESGIQFHLMFNTERDYFFWVLDEAVPVPDTWTELAENIVVGDRTGFVFWSDPEAGDRKVLATIRKISVLRNDYYDGPFDQLSDNYAEEIDIKSWIERAIPGIKGRIDRYGYYTDTERPSRVALSNYGTYYTFAEAVQFIENARESFDPYYYISRGGIPPRGLKWDGTPAPNPPAATPATPAPAAEAEEAEEAKGAKGAKGAEAGN